MIRGIINIGKIIRLKKTITIGLVAILVSEMVFNTAYADLNKLIKNVMPRGTMSNTNCNN